MERSMTARQLIEECKKRTTLEECQKCPHKGGACWRLSCKMTVASPSEYDKILNSEEHL